MLKPKYLTGFLEILQPLVDINFQESKHIEKISNLWDFSWENTEENNLRHYDVMKTATVHLLLHFMLSRLSNFSLTLTRLRVYIPFINYVGREEREF